MICAEKHASKSLKASSRSIYTSVFGDFLLSSMPGCRLEVDGLMLYHLKNQCLLQLHSASSSTMN